MRDHKRRQTIRKQRLYIANDGCLTKTRSGVSMYSLFEWSLCVATLCEWSRSNAQWRRVNERSNHHTANTRA